MADVWLHANRRALAWGMLPPAAALGLALGIGAFSADTRWAWLGLTVAGLLGSAAGAMLLYLVYSLGVPRLAYRAGKLLVYLQPAQPIAVPIEIVECFLLSQGPSLLPGAAHQRTESTCVIIRLSEKAEDWQQREVKPALGSWCGGHITLRGTWCEPLSVAVVDRLNRQLAAVMPAPATRSRA